MALTIDGATVVVQIGFGSAPGTAIASIVWTDVTDYVRALSFSYGRSSELDAYQGGQLSATLDNRLRRFDPLYSSGPYFGNLKPMVPIRVQVTYGGTTVTAWLGFVSGFPQAYDPPNDATVALTASDGFTVLARAKLTSAYAYDVRTDTPSLWWRLGEQSGTTAVDVSGNHADGIYVNGATFNSRAGFVVDPDTAIGFDATQAATGYMTAPATPFTVEFWSSQTADGGILRFNRADLYGVYVTVDVFGGGYRAAITSTAGVLNGLAVVTTATGYNNGVAHHVVVVFDTSALPVIYVDGALAPLTTILNDTSPAITWSAVTSLLQVPDQQTPLQAGYVGTVDEFAIYSSALSSSRVVAHHASGTAPFLGLDTGTAISYVLDRIGWPTADRNIETGKSTVVSFDISGRTALEVIQDLERTEQGRFFIAPDGKATFYNRHHTLVTAASTTSQATFGDAPGELGYGELKSEFDDIQIRNSITTQPANGSAFLVEDAASIFSHLHREFPLTGLLNSSDGEIRDMGLWQLGHYKDPATRIPQITVNPRSSPSSLFPQIRDRKPADRVTVKRRPQNVGSAIAIDVLIEGVQHTITVDEWLVAYYLSPADVVGYLVLDHPTLGKLDNNRLAF